MQRSQRVIVTLLLVGLMLALAACGAAPAQPAPPAAESAPTQQEAAAAPEPAAAATEPAAAETAATSTYSEAPMLAEMVAAGTLPPVDERLPVNPMVVEPFGEIGKYGGTLRMMDVATTLGIGLRIRHTGLFRYDQTASHFEPDLAEGYEWSNGNRTLTLHLREGLRWSDGEPFTTADMLFKWEQDNLNEELHPGGLDGFWTTGGAPAVWEALDDTTLNITWAGPNPVAMDRFGRTHFSGDNELFLPAHYMQQFHKDFNPDVDKVAKDAGFESWVDLFNDRKAQGYNEVAVTIGRPYMDSHVPELVESDRVVVVRNPYYHHVDTAGNQLPYIDRVEVTLVGDKALYALKASAGEVDFAAYYTGAPDLPTYKAGEAAGNYTTYIAQSLNTSELVIWLNQNIADPFLNSLFTNLDFRVALSVALNRAQMNEIVFYGLGDAHPATPLRTMEFFRDEWYNDNLAYDPDRANQLLDAVGLAEKDSEGFRLNPETRERFSLVVEVGVQEGTKERLCELVSNDWRAVGIEGACQIIDGTLQQERLNNNETVVSAWHLGRSTLLGRGTPDTFAFENCAANNWARQWCIWFVSGGESGIEPPQDIKDLNALWQEFKQTATGTPEAIELGGRYYAYFAEQMPQIPTVGLIPQPVIVHNRLKNVPTDDIFWGSDTNFYAPYKPEQWYIDE